MPADAGRALRLVRPGVRLLFAGFTGERLVVGLAARVLPLRDGLLLGVAAVSWLGRFRARLTRERLIPPRPEAGARFVRKTHLARRLRPAGKRFSVGRRFGGSGASLRLSSSILLPGWRFHPPKDRHEHRQFAPAVR